MLKLETIKKCNAKEYFKVVDLYEDYGTIDRCFSLTGARKIKSQHCLDCDDECNVVILKYVLKDGEYIFARECY